MHDRKLDCENKGIPFVPVYVNADNKDNSQIIRVLDVSRPYSVLDDLSYKICKGNKQNPVKDRLLNFLHLTNDIEAPEGISAEELVPPVPTCDIFPFNACNKPYEGLAANIKKPSNSDVQSTSSCSSCGACPSCTSPCSGCRSPDSAV